MDLSTWLVLTDLLPPVGCPKHVDDSRSSPSKITEPLLKSLLLKINQYLRHDTPRVHEQQRIPRLPIMYDLVKGWWLMLRSWTLYTQWRVDALPCQRLGVIPTDTSCRASQCARLGKMSVASANQTATVERLSLAGYVHECLLAGVSVDKVRLQRLDISA